jgi:Tol biopolymer transport system component
MRTSMFTLGLLFTSLLGLAGCSSSDSPGGSADAPVEIEFTDTSAQEARFSPDGKSFAYVTLENGSSDKSSLAVMTTTGEQRTTLAPAGGYLAGPAWAPDGKQIYFGSDVGISQVAASGGTPTLAVDDFATLDPDVSPDGKSLVYAINGGNLQLVDLATPTMAKSLGVAGTSPRFSPDGKTIAFESGEKIQLMDLETLMVKDVSIDAGTYLASVDWFPDGKQLAITSDDGIEIVTLDSPPTRKVVREEFAAKDIDVSPDGKSIAYGVNGSKNIFVLSGF